MCCNKKIVDRVICAVIRKQLIEPCAVIRKQLIEVCSEIRKQLIESCAVIRKPLIEPCAVIRKQLIETCSVIGKQLIETMCCTHWRQTTTHMKAQTRDYSPSGDQTRWSGHQESWYDDFSWRNRHHCSSNVDAGKGEAIGNISASIWHRCVPVYFYITMLNRVWHLCQVIMETPIKESDGVWYLCYSKLTSNNCTTRILSCPCTPRLTVMQLPGLLAAHPLSGSLWYSCQDC